ncbi:thioredoxin family protein [Geodermatophilus sp. SYSU D00691]
MPVQHTTDATFADDVLASPKPVLVEFGAAWCAPCKMMAPVLENLSVDQAARLKVVALDVDESPATASAYKVMGMPTLALFVRGQMVTTMVGGRPGWSIMQEIEPHLAALV